MLENAPNHPTKFRTKNWVEINYLSRGMYNTNSQTKIKTSMLRSHLCDYGDAYILLSGTITITEGPNDITDVNTRADERNKLAIFKNCATFTDCISEINNSQIDSAKYLDVVMSMHNLTEYNRFNRFQFKIKITWETPDIDNKENVEIAVPLKYVSKFWRTLEMPLVNSEINLVLTWPENCVISSTTRETKFKITDAKLYFPAVTLSIQYNSKLLKQLNSGFERSINWNKYQTKVSPERQNQYLGFLIDPSFEGVNRTFVLSFENHNKSRRWLHSWFFAGL